MRDPYWTKETEEYVRIYLSMEQGSIEANELFQHHIYAPLLILVKDVAINNSAILVDFDFETVILDVLGHITIKFDRYDPCKGPKAYSYFKVAARNYMRNLKRNQDRYRNRFISLDTLEDV